VMAISIISISLDSSEESVGTSSGRVLWFTRIPTIVLATTPTVTPPTTHIDTILTPTEIPTVSPIVSPSLDYTPASPDYSPASDTEPDPSGDPLSDHIPPIPATSPFLSSADITERPSYSSPVGPSRKRSRSPTTSVLLSSPTPGASSSVRADLLPPRKRVMSSDSMTDLEDCSDESFEPSRQRLMSVLLMRMLLELEGLMLGLRVTHPIVPDDIHELAQEEGAVEVTYETLGDLVKRFHDLEIPVHRVKVIESIQRDQGHMIVASSQQGTVMSDRISELEQDNTRIRGMLIKLSVITSLDALSDSSSGHSSSDHSSLALSSGPSLILLMRGPSRRGVGHLPHMYGVSSPILELCTFFLRDDVLSGVVMSYQSLDIEPKVRRERSMRYIENAELPLRAEGIDARVVVETVSPRGEVRRRSTRGTVLRFRDDRRLRISFGGRMISLSAQGGVKERSLEIIESIQRDQGHMIVATGQQSAVLSERISELEQDNMRLRGRTMPNTRSGATMKREGINEQIDRRVAEALETRDAARNLEPLAEGGDEQCWEF
ncbi:hypothetical protein Tco_1269886, partial [Tanacetum coccineum]